MATFNFPGRSLPLNTPRVMGILNLTADSFSDGGELLADGRPDLEKIVSRASTMVAAGATILDLGGESTRPGAMPVSSEQELDRVLPVLEALKNRFEVVLSLDTSNPELIREGAAIGAGMINDVRALTVPGAMAAVADCGLPVCLMHMQGQPGTMQDAPVYADVVTDVLGFLVQRVQDCIAAGIRPESIILDPGFGFGKTLEHNLQLMRNLDKFSQLPYPLLVGVSRKRMLGEITGKPAKDRVWAGIGAAVIAVMQGAWIIRTHDVVATVDALKVCAHVRTPGLSQQME